MATKLISKTLFVGNLHASLEETDLLEIFRPFGRIVECCKRWCHYGFIQFATEDEARLAFNHLNGSKVRGRPMRIEFQRKKLRNLQALLEAGMDGSYPFPKSGSFGELDDLRSFLGFGQQQTTAYSASNFGLNLEFENKPTANQMLAASAFQSKKLVESKSIPYFGSNSNENVTFAGNQMMQQGGAQYPKCFYRPQSLAESDAKSFFSLSSPSSSISSNSSSSCFQSNMAMIFDELLVDCLPKPTGMMPPSSSNFQLQHSSSSSHLSLCSAKSSTNDRTVLSANINHANIQHFKPAIDQETSIKKPDPKDEDAATCDDPTDLLNALLDKALLDVYDEEESSCDEHLVSAVDADDASQKVSEGHKLHTAACSIRSNGTSPAFSPMSSTGTGPSRAVPSPSFSKPAGSNPHSAAYRSRDQDASADSNSLVLYRSINTSNTIFVQPTDVLEPLNEGEFDEYKLFPSSASTAATVGAAKTKSTSSAGEQTKTDRSAASWSSKHSKNCINDNLELLVVDYTPPFSVSLSPNTSPSSCSSNASSLSASPSSSPSATTDDRKETKAASYLSSYSSSQFAAIF